MLTSNGASPTTLCAGLAIYSSLTASGWHVKGPATGIPSPFNQNSAAQGNPKTTSTVQTNFTESLNSIGSYSGIVGPNTLPSIAPSSNLQSIRHEESATVIAPLSASTETSASMTATITSISWSAEPVLLSGTTYQSNQWQVSTAKKRSSVTTLTVYTGPQQQTVLTPQYLYP